MVAGCDLFTPQREQTDAGGLYDATTPDGSRDAVMVDLGVNDASTCESGPACAPGCSGTCCKGRCLEALASGHDNAVAIAVDGQNVYWATAGKMGSIVRVPTQGGTPVTLATLQNHPVSLALDAGHLYWLNQGDLPDNGTVMSLPLGGGAPVTVASGQPDPQAIAVDSSRVYWTNFGPPDGGLPNGYVVSVPVGGGTPTTLATAGTLPAGIAVDDGYVYWASCSGVQRLSLDGGTSEQVASPPFAGSGCATSIAVDAERVFWWLQWARRPKRSDSY